MGWQRRHHRMRSGLVLRSSRASGRTIADAGLRAP